MLSNCLLILMFQVLNRGLFKLNFYCLILCKTLSLGYLKIKGGQGKVNDFDDIVFRFKKSRKNKFKVIIVSFLLLILASFFIGLDLVRVQPLIIYLIAMTAAIYYANHIRVESGNFQKLERFIKTTDKQLLKNKLLIFFMDYHLNYEYTDLITENEYKNLTKATNWTSGEIVQLLQTIVPQLKEQFDNLKDAKVSETDEFEEF